MRLWSLHPAYLDARGLVALWREALLAREVLRGNTRGYRHHPQLDRFRASAAPLSAINAYLAKFTEFNAAAAGLKGRVRVVVGDALRVLPMLRGPVDFLLIDAKKEDYLDYLRAVEPRLVKGALVIADNTGMFRRDVKPYLDHVRESGRYQSREHDFGFDCMEASVFRG